MESEMTTSRAEGRNIRFPIYALCNHNPDRPNEDFLAQGEVEGHQCVVFYHNNELAELAVEQASKKSSERHHLVTIDDKQNLIEVLTAIPHDVRHVLWNKQLE